MMNRWMSATCNTTFLVQASVVILGPCCALRHSVSKCQPHFYFSQSSQDNVVLISLLFEWESRLGSIKIKYCNTTLLLFLWFFIPTRPELVKQYYSVHCLWWMQRLWFWLLIVYGWCYLSTNLASVGKSFIFFK